MTNDVAGVAPPEPGANPELAAEQRHVDRAYAQLDRMRHAAEQVARGFDDVSRGGTHQARLERDVAAAHTRRRLAALELGDAPLCFGRLDMLADATDPADPGPFHVGRLSVTDDELSPLVVDWRAPVAEPFYRATAIEPMGVGRRRHFQTRGRRILGIDDEVFDAAVSEASGLTVVGEAALLSALRRERTGRMHDIVATIQAEQDEAIRAPITGVLVVSGGPGTGKTAVALHRAAYLLYTHRRRLASQGVLLVGPSAMFLRYIDEVLPSLGEDEVVLATARALKPRLRVTGVDAADVAALKGSARMASVIARAVRDRERPMPREVVVVLDGFRLRMRRRDSAQIVGRAHARRGTHNSRRPFVVSAVLEHFRRDYRRRLVDAYRADHRRLEGGRDAGAGGSHRVPAFDVQIGALLARGEPAPPEWNEELTRRLRRAPEIVAALERMWPVLTGAALVHDLLGFEGLIRSAAADALSADEQRTLFRPRVVDVATVPWTEADLALIDEADALLGPPSASRPRRGRARRSAAELEQARRTVEELGVSAFTTAEEMLDRYAGSAPARSDDDGETRTFGHVLVDEAQDLSAMQWRMLARRCPSGSMTLVGDFAQATKPGALPGWDDVLAQLPERVPPRVVTLSVNYRTPREIMDFANRLLPVAAPGIAPARAVRDGGVDPQVVTAETGEVVEAAAAAARGASRRGGTVAVLAPAALHDPLAAELRDRGAVADADDAIDAPIAILEAADSKGLEFDHVVVVEPADLVTRDAAGLRLLYVVLTRATRDLVVVHSSALPEALAQAPRTDARPDASLAHLEWAGADADRRST